MIESIHSDHTLYAIHLNLVESKQITVGKLGTFTFQKGTYIYVGSAKRNITQRIERHVKINKKHHWHFDYLRPFGTITRIITYDNSLRECELAENIRKEKMAAIPINGFGSSDCKCKSHLLFIEEK
ncbi:GIY-YIG nuclease family protein [Bacillus tuaregi]|uniref:GIY-YIG nuclease family protein n=1 Tax=Bacillus tuaregi TaxID=1816695 RepID=UPI0008F94506|nr:GIY-YIG nuclease family protein [Bacillus tuaregi]